MFAFYEGKSTLSKLIKWFTWSCYSHVSWVNFNKEEYIATGFPKGEEWEAWQPTAVKVDKMGANHTPETIVDLYEFVTPLTDEETKIFIEYLNSKVGTPYDYLGLFMFILRSRKKGDDKKLFCSEYMIYACQKIGRTLLNNRNPWQVSPEMMSESPLLKKWGTVMIDKR